jgi:hypothetical protein
VLLNGIRTTAYLFGLTGLVFVAPGCGSDPEGESTGPASADAPDQFTLEGRGGSDETASTLRVIEGKRDVVLTVRGADAMGSLIVIALSIDGVENVIGSHSADIGLPGSLASAAGTLDGLAYYSLHGQIDVEVSADGGVSGSFDAALAVDDGRGPPLGVPADSIAEAVTIAGAFQNQWMITCTSTFTGGHVVSDSPYCNTLTL